MRALFALGSFTLVVFGGLWLYARADTFVLRLQGARRLHFEEAPRLHALLVRLCIAARMPCPRLYQVRGTRPEAYSLGTRDWHASIVLTSAAFEALDEAQLRAMLAHELAHITHRHTGRATAVAVLAVLWVRAASGLGALLASGPRFGALVQAVGRRLQRLGTPPERDFLADRAAARLLGDPRGLAAVLDGLKAHAHRSPSTEGPRVGAHFIPRAADPAHLDARIHALHRLAAEERARRSGVIRLRAAQRPSRFFPRSRLSAPARPACPPACPHPRRPSLSVGSPLTLCPRA